MHIIVEYHSHETLQNFKEKVERNYLLTTFQLTGGNIALLKKISGLQTSTFYRKTKYHGIHL
ncbi:MAG: hypothetical protein Q8Q33_04560 [Chlamydiota bacterium]|nr:hypothetical protein [Chlamydiota bacterium]